jgi:hypothetical protein
MKLIILLELRYKTLLWLDDTDSPENARVLRDIPGHKNSKPSQLPEHFDGTFLFEAHNANISLTDQVDVILFTSVEAISAYLSTPSYTKFAKYPKSLFRIICNERMLEPLLEFLDSRSIFAGSFPAICATSRPGIAALPQSAQQKCRRPNLIHCDQCPDSALFRLFALFEPLPNIM